LRRRVNAPELNIKAINVESTRLDIISRVGGDQKEGNLVHQPLRQANHQVPLRMTGNVDRAIWPDLVARAIRNAALATPRLEQAFVLGLVGWLHVELLFHFRIRGSKPWDHVGRAVFACRSRTHGQWRRTSGRERHRREKRA